MNHKTFFGSRQGRKERNERVCFGEGNVKVSQFLVGNYGTFVDRECHQIDKGLLISEREFHNFNS